jgi:hypothetical protein
MTSPINFHLRTLPIRQFLVYRRSGQNMPKTKITTEKSR